jgi:hypothetical protein
MLLSFPSFFYFHETSFRNLEEEKKLEKLLFYEKNDDKEIDNIASLFHIERHKCDISCFHFYGDPIYDTSDDSFKDNISYLWSFG